MISDGLRSLGRCWRRTLSLPPSHLQDSIYLQVSNLESNLNPGRTNSREEAISEILGRSERQREAAHKREGVVCTERAETPESSLGED